jgi:hypothetical protein
MFRHIVSSPWIFDVVSRFDGHGAAAYLFDDREGHIDAGGDAGGCKHAVVNDPAIALHLNAGVNGCEQLERRPVRGRALAVEHNFEEPKRSQIEELMKSHGFVKAHTWHQDDFYLAAR